jgi:hypothetical protein
LAVVNGFDPASGLFVDARGRESTQKVGFLGRRTDDPIGHAGERN